MTSKQTFLGPGDSIGEGDTYVLYDFLPPELADTALDNLLKEVQWNKMSHRGKTAQPWLHSHTLTSSQVARFPGLWLSKARS